MNELVFHIVSGQSFFTGIVLLMTGVLASHQPRRLLRRGGGLLVVVGLIAIVVSSTPLPWWYFTLAGTATLFWMVAAARGDQPPATDKADSSAYAPAEEALPENALPEMALPEKTHSASARSDNTPTPTAAAEQQRPPQRRPQTVAGGLPAAAAIVIVVWLGAAVLELPWHSLPTPNRVTRRKVAIVGDSVTAGVGAEDSATTWPVLLADTHRLDVQDISHVGETAGSAWKRVVKEGPDAPLVIVEIGGNDILGSTSADQFRQDLEGLLRELSRPDREIVMFELPLPPFFHQYGHIQRMIARRYGVLLIPKRIFLSVIAGGDATLDTIHLSQAGHRLMMETVWQIIGPAYAETDQ